MTQKMYVYSRYAGVLFGITNSVGTIPGMVAPTVAAALTPNVRIVAQIVTSALMHNISMVGQKSHSAAISSNSNS
mgnify:CR=1 FL=1